jgi:hypothetical protein
MRQSIKLFSLIRCKDAVSFRLEVDVKTMLAVLIIGIVGTKYFKSSVPSVLSPRTNGIKFVVKPAFSSAFEIRPGESPPKCV